MIMDDSAGDRAADPFGPAAFADVLKGSGPISAQRAAAIQNAAAAQAADLAILRGIRLEFLDPLVLPDHGRRLEA